MIYLDNSATTKALPAVAQAVEEGLCTRYYNPSAAYGAALAEEKEVHAARAAVAISLGVPAEQLTFTSGGTESANMVLRGVFSARKSGELVITAGEHPCVAETARALEKQGVPVKIAPLTAEGTVNEEALLALINHDTALVACMHVNNITGAVNPVEKLALQIKQKAPQALFFADGVQAHLRVPVFSFSALDFYSVSAHKIHGPKGVGALYIKNSKTLLPLFTGGGQQALRSGTLNTPAILGYRAAVEGWGADSAKNLAALRQQLVEKLSQISRAVVCNGTCFAPHILAVSFPPVRAAVLQSALEQEGVLVGNGAACSSRSSKVNPVLTAMSLPQTAAEGMVRISLGLYNTPAEMDSACGAIQNAVSRLSVYRRK